jgi:hypothetical protein
VMQWNLVCIGSVVAAAIWELGRQNNREKEERE